MRNIQCVSYLLWGHIECDHSHVHLGVVVNTGQDEEDPRAPGSTRQKTTQPEDDSSLVLLHHLHCEEETEGEGDDDEEEGEESDEAGADSRPVHQKVCSHQITIINFNFY